MGESFETITTGEGTAPEVVPGQGFASLRHPNGNVPGGAQVQYEMPFVNPHGKVTCLLCGSPAPPDALFWGCPACGIAAPLTIAFQMERRGRLEVRSAAGQARRHFSLLAAEFDDAPAAPTPLAAAPRFGKRVYLKNEAFSLTGSHKDRYQSIASRVAGLLGCRGIVASSTGNHGVSAAAHAAAAGLPAVVFCHPDAPPGLLRAIGAFGGIAAQLAADDQARALIEMVTQGWFPATSLDPVLTGAANPFAAEGYKAVAYETAEQLGALPDAFFIPTAGGDTYYGIMKGFSEVAALSGSALPVVFAIQPEGANSLSQSLAAGHQVTLTQPDSIALSLSDRQTGRHAMDALARWGGRVIDVTEVEIRTAIVDLAGMGIYADPASAAALAGYRRAIAAGFLDPGATAVLLLTSSGFKWPDSMAEVFAAVAVQSVSELKLRIADF